MELILWAGAIIFAVIVLYLLLRPEPAQYSKELETKCAGTRAADDSKATYVREPVTRETPRFRTAPPPVRTQPSPYSARSNTSDDLTNALLLSAMVSSSPVSSSYDASPGYSSCSSDSSSSYSSDSSCSSSSDSGVGGD
jgi:hypothetical protein